MATEVKIKIRAFPYYVDAEDPVSGRKRKVEKIAMRGDEVELSDEDLARAKRFDALDTGDSGESGAEPSATSDVQSLARWIQEDKPTVDETVDKAEGDPAKATTLLEAESVATGGDPRKGVVEGLEDIIEDGSG